METNKTVTVKLSKKDIEAIIECFGFTEVWLDERPEHVKIMEVISKLSKVFDKLVKDWEV